MRVKRVVIANLGTDEHWKSGMFCARTLRDAGVEVIYLGNPPPESIADAAIQEDADMVLLETTSGHHMAVAPKVVEVLREKDAGDIPVVLGGDVPPADVAKLLEAGIVRVFGPGTPLQGIVEIISAHARL
jgi:methylmalonyl-CoA mutase C-terminal domain/subunit